MEPLVASLTKREGLQEKGESREELSLGYIDFQKLRDPGQRSRRSWT